MARKEVAELLIKIQELGGEILDRLVITFDDIINVVGQVPRFFAAAFDAYREQEQAVNTLNQAMINQGVYTAELQRKYLDLAGSLQKSTGFTDDQINAAQALLQSHIGSKEVTEDLLLATLNLAAAKKMDLAGAADLVGKSISMENDVLSRHGIKLDEAAAKNDKLGAVVEALDRKFHGQAEAMTKGTGAANQSTKSFGELMEVVGERLAPAINKLAYDFGRIFDKMAGWIGSNSLAKKSSAELTDEIITLQKKINEFNAKPLTQMQKQLNMNLPELDVMNTKMAEIKAARDKAFADEAASIQNNYQNKKEKDKEYHETKLVTDLERNIASHEMEMAMMGANEEQKLAVQAQYEMRRAESAKTHTEKVQALKAAANLKEQQAEAKARALELEMQKKVDEEYIRNRDSTLNRISTLQSSSNHHLATIGKAAALTQIAIATPEAVAKAYTLGPIAGPIAAGLVYTAMAAQAAQVAGIQLAEGGIVRARPGGIQATIGEGGQDEAVIPLDRAGEFGLGGGGGNITIVVNGGLLGDEASAYEFAKAVDKNLLKLRQNNESQAFDSGVI